MLITGRFGAFARTREVPKRCLRQGNSRTARNRLDFVLAANRLYGACIRGARAPASLKRGRRDRQRAAPTVHPGRARPGLIEAPMPSVATDRWRQGIRGARAPASLKHFLLQDIVEIAAVHPGRARPGLIEANSASGPANGRTSTHPGRARPGLIEASAPMSRESSPRCCIRGARAPASLKRRTFYPRDQIGDRIRGARAPASLKLSFRGQPGEACPASGARAPRPH